MYRIWQQLTTPHPAITDEEERQRARWLLNILVLIIPLDIITSWLIAIDDDVLALGLMFGTIALALFLLAYIIARTRHYQWAGWLLVGTISIVAAIGSLITQPVDVPLPYVLISSILALTLFPPISAIIIIACNMALTLVVGFIGQLTFDRMLDEMILIIVVSLLMGLMARLRYEDMQHLRQQSQELLEKEKTQLQAEIERERAELLHSFLNSLSHDLKTPISIIKTRIYLLRNNPKPEHLDVLDAQADRLADLIEDMLTMVRLDKRESLTMVRLNLAPLVNAIQEQTQFFLDKHGLQRDTTIDPAVYQYAIVADIKYMNMAARKFYETLVYLVKPQSRLELRLSIEKDRLVFHMKGCLKNPNIDVDRLFGRLSRIDEEARNTSGETGLGLAIVQRIIQLHGGQVKIRKEAQGDYAVFEMWLPALKQTAKLQAIQTAETVER